MRKSTLLAAFVMPATVQAEIPGTIDSSTWAADPIDYGMTAKECM